MLFRDRTDAGHRLADALGAYRGRNVVVLALPRGGVPVGLEVARALGVPLDVFVVRKLGVPGHDELAMGAIASGGATVLNEDVIFALDLEPSIVEEVADREWGELRRRERAYRGDKAATDVRDRTVVLVDDGIATGASMRAAVQAVRSRGPASVVVAVPVAPSTTCARLREVADDVVCLDMPEPFFGVGQWYADFHQLSDDDVRVALERAGDPTTPEGRAG